MIVYGEVYEGILADPAFEERLTSLADFIAGLMVLSIDRETAETFARLQSGLRARGELIPDHDTWIAATALRYGLILLSRDHHFERIAELRRQ